jgi:hypothetical protein
MSKLLLDQAVSPPRLQAFAGLDNVLPQLVSLRGNELLCTVKDSLAFGWQKRQYQLRLQRLSQRRRLIVREELGDRR